MADQNKPTGQETPKPEASDPSVSSTSIALGEKPKQEEAKADPASSTPPKSSEDKPKEGQPEVTKETTKDAPKEEEKPKVPEKYELKLPEGSPLKAEHVEKVAAYAKAQGLSNEQAQAILERENGAVSSFVQEQNETIKTKMDSWVNEIKADKEIGGDAYDQTLSAAKRAVSRFATPEFIQSLNETGLGNHPELVRVFARIGKAMSDDHSVFPGAQSGGKKSIEDIFYPNSKS
jgi:hypothetical protein